MQLTMERLKHDTFSLCRCINAVSARVANGFLGGFQNINTVPRNEWVRLESIIGTGYIFIESAGHAGRYQNNPPSGVDKANISTIEVNTDISQVRYLIDTLSQLITQLSSKVNVSIEGTLEKLNLVDPDIEELNLLLLLLLSTKKSLEEGYNEHIVSVMASETQGVIASSDNRTISLVKDILIEKTNKIGEMHQMFAADGMLTSWTLFYHDAVMKLYQHFNENNEAQIGQHIARCMTFGIAGIINEPNNLLLMFVNKLTKENEQNIAVELGWQYLDIGEDYLNKALDSQDLEAFGTNLYNASIYLFSARQIFMGLTQNEYTTSLTNIAEYKKAEKVADEKTVRVQHALCNIVMNRTGERFRIHQRQIEEEREKTGDNGAAQKIFELIEMFYFYPRYYAEKLNERLEQDIAKH